MAPNVVLIVADDLGWADTGSTGGGSYQTPAIDSIARAGIQFTNAYAASSVCSPTRASLLTGLHPARLRMTGAHAHLADDRFSAELPTDDAAERAFLTPPTATRISPRLPNLAQVLKAEGYATALIGKWHLGAGEYMPKRYGFDVSYPDNSEPLARGYLAPWGTEGLPTDQPTGRHLDDYLAEQASDFIAEQGEQPYFMAFWPYSVHWPHQAAKEKVAKYDQLLDGQGVRQNPVMAAMLEHLDEAVAQVLEAVQASPRAADTLIIFTSDNGGVDWMAAGKYAAMATDNSPLRGGKAQLYEGGLRVPLFISWPDQIDAGQQRTHLVSSQDIFPTLMEVMSLSLSRTQIDGYSFAGLLFGEEASARRHHLAHMPHYVDRLKAQPSTSLRSGKYKLLRIYGSSDSQSITHELYDLLADPGERKDLAEELPGKVAELRGEMDTWLQHYEAIVPQPNPAFSVLPAAENPAPD